MKQSKYSISEFWSGLFENQPISRDSVIISPVILNSYTNQAKSAWAVYPNVQSVLGFIKFLYLPSAFIGLIKENLDYQRYFAEDLGRNLHDYKEKYPNKVNLVTKM